MGIGDRFLKIRRYFLSLFALSIVGIVLNLTFVNCGKFSADSAGIYQAGNFSSFNTDNPNDVPPTNGGATGGATVGTTGGTSSGTSSGSTSGTTGGATSGSTSTLVTNFAGTVDPNCLNSSSYDTCVIFKNPVASRKAKYPTILKRGDNLDEVQTLGVKLENRLNPRVLRSNSIIVTATSGTTPQIDSSGKVMIRYSDDRSTSWLAQLMAYFWITTQEREMRSRTGDFFAGNKSIPVDAFYWNPSNPSMDASTRGNAYYSSSENKVVLGYAKTSNTDPTIAHEMALSAEVYLHEMGHANFHHAVKSNNTTANLGEDVNAIFWVKYNNGRYAYITYQDLLAYYNSQQTVRVAQWIASFCQTNQGCVGGINEGVADFHHLMLFPNSTPLGETIVNDTAGGLNSKEAIRDVAQTLNWTVADFYTKSNPTVTVTNASGSNVGQASAGEIHGMGSAYAAILWGIYNHPSVNKAHFEVIFSNHLKLMDGSFTFARARNALVSTAQMMKANFGNIDYSPYITQVFTAKGVP